MPASKQAASLAREFGKRFGVDITPESILELAAVSEFAEEKSKTKIPAEQFAAIEAELHKLYGKSDPEASEATSAPIAEAETAPPKRQRKMRSAKDPKHPKPAEPDPAASELVEYLEQFNFEGAEYPADATRFQKGNTKYLSGTTIDGVKLTITIREAVDNLRRSNKLRYVLPLFSDEVSREIVTRVAALKAAPQPDALGPFGEKLFASRTAWYYNMLQVGCLIWAGEINPPGLDLEAHPHRKGIPEATFRFRAVDIGLVMRIIDVFDEEALDLNLRGSELEHFEAQWIEEFIAGQRTVAIGGDQKDFRDFKVSGKQGTPEQFKQIWALAQDEQRKAARNKKSGRH